MATSLPTLAGPVKITLLTYVSNNASSVTVIDGASTTLTDPNAINLYAVAGKGFASPEMKSDLQSPVAERAIEVAPLM